MAKSVAAVGMSGGVDSTAAAWLLLKRGWDVVGITMSVWDGSLSAEGCRGGCFSSDEDGEIKEAKKLARRLGIKHYVVDMRREYRGAVLDYFRREYLAGRTPNPCVVCNREIKLGALLEKAAALAGKFDFFATGHYARIAKKAGRYILKKGVDERKDQSYFLWKLGQNQLARLIFPLGEMTKDEVRALARKNGLADAADKPESQDFLGPGGYLGLFSKKEIRPGPVYSPDGKLLGEHKGLVHYTVGQRKGLGALGSGEPLYVARLDAARNAVIAAPLKALRSRVLRANQTNWIALADIKKPFRAKAAIRRQHKPAPATVYPKPGGKAVVEFDSPQFAVTPGQSVVFYRRDAVLGGGVIE